MSVSSRRPGAKTPTDFAAAVQRLLPIVRMGGRASHADSIRAQREIGEIVLKFIPDKPKHGDGAYAGLGKAIGHGGEWVYRASSPLNLSFFSRRHSEGVGGGEKVLPVDWWWSDCGGRDESLPGGKTRKINSTRRPEQVVHVLLQTSRRSHLE